MAKWFFDTSAMVPLPASVSGAFGRSSGRPLDAEGNGPFPKHPGFLETALPPEGPPLRDPASSPGKGGNAPDSTLQYVGGTWTY